MIKSDLYTPELGEEICRKIADGESLRKICEDLRMPGRSTVFAWLLRPEMKEFQEAYTRARELSGEADADDVSHYARQAATGEIKPDAANAAINGLKWSAGKRAPKKYGDKVSLVGGGPDDAPVRMDLSGLTDEQLRALASIPVR